MSKKMNRDNTVLVCVDFQDRIMPAMEDKEELERKANKLIRGFRVLGAPVIVSQQYTRGLGETIPSIAESLGEFQPIEKTTFSCMETEEFARQMDAYYKEGRRCAVVCGIEAHVCVLQTAIDLLEKGYTVFMVCDCVSSRNRMDQKYAEDRLRDLGGFTATCESVLFELLKGAKEAGFKEISALVK